MKPFKPVEETKPPGRLAKFFRKSDGQGAEAALINLLHNWRNYNGYQIKNIEGKAP